jgi:hypothetical protein
MEQTAKANSVSADFIYLVFFEMESVKYGQYEGWGRRETNVPDASSSIFEANAGICARRVTSKKKAPDFSSAFHL